MNPILTLIRLSKVPKRKETGVGNYVSLIDGI